MLVENAIGVPAGATISTVKTESNMLAVDASEAKVNLYELIGQRL